MSKYDAPSPIDPQGENVKQVLRFVGPVILGIGVILMIVGGVDFFSAFGTGRPPGRFWCFFLAIPALWLGFALSMGGFMGRFFRYQVSQVAPVQKDYVHYMTRETAPDVETAAEALGTGLARGFERGREHSPPERVSCPTCHAENDTTAHFCSQCGGAIKPRG